MHLSIMRTTIDIEDPVLRDLKAYKKQAGKSLGKACSELLRQALDSQMQDMRSKPSFRWNSSPMGARINLSDKEGIYAMLDSDSKE